MSGSKITIVGGEVLYVQQLGWIRELQSSVLFTISYFPRLE